MRPKTAKKVKGWKSCKKGVDNIRGVCYNNQAVSERSKRQRAILENDTEKVILYKKNVDEEHRKVRRGVDNSQILKE